MNFILLAATIASNAFFTVTWNEKNGGLDSLVLNNDPDRMNWIEVTDDALEETCVFTNVEKFPLYFLRGDLGILATFNDSYAQASVCETKRCHARVWSELSNDRGERADPFVNDMDVVLYMAMCSGLLGAYGDTTMAGGQRE